MKLTQFYRIAFILILSGTHSNAESAPAKSTSNPLPLHVVRTWGNLRAQTPVTLNTTTKDPSPPPVAYRLGIDSSETQLYGGVVLYCLANDGKAVFWGREKVGPFLIDVQAPTSSQYAKDAQMMQKAFQMEKKQANAEVLYMKTIPFHQAGNYTITVKKPIRDAKDAKFETVAVSTVKVQKKPGPLWSPWPLNAANGAVGLLAHDDDPAYSADGVANPSTGVAIPKMPEWVGTGPKPPALGQLLPQLMPTEPDPGVKLQVSGALLIITLDHGIQPEFPDEKFLTRWWINGKPFTPELKPSQFSSYYDMRHNGAHTIENSATEICFQVEFHPEILGAKKGDRIGVQLLLCPHGWESSGPEPWAKQLDAMAPDDIDARFQQPRMSNRVTFMYTGDPAKMAPQ